MVAQHLLKLKIATKAKMLLWCILENEITTSENLKNRSFQGPSWCLICREVEESIEHLFLSSQVASQVWNMVYQGLFTTIKWQGDNISQA